jgi:hypothetical protein
MGDITMRSLGARVFLAGRRFKYFATTRLNRIHKCEAQPRIN